MKKDKVYRRDFLKLVLTSIGAILASCMPRVTQTLAPTLTPTSTNTRSPEPTSTITQTSTPTETPTPTEIPCFHLLTPENGAKLPTVGKVTFSWEAMPGAASYRLEIILPTSQSVIFETTYTSRGQYIEAIRIGGEFHWRVSALDISNQIICVTELFSFIKPEYIPPSATSYSSPTDNTINQASPTQPPRPTEDVIN